MIYFKKDKIEKNNIKRKKINVPNINPNFSLRESYLQFKTYLKSFSKIVISILIIIHVPIGK